MTSDTPRFSPRDRLAAIARRVDLDPPMTGRGAAAKRPNPHSPAGVRGLHQSDPRWVVLFHEEEHAIRRRLGRTDVAVEHVGSSSVAGLVGRAEIDILVGVRRNAEVPPCVRALLPLNYRIVSQSQSPNESWAYLTRAGAVQSTFSSCGTSGPCGDAISRSESICVPILLVRLPMAASRSSGRPTTERAPPRTRRQSGGTGMPSRHPELHRGRPSNRGS